MASAIYLPKVGMTMEEATLTKWVQADGAEVKRGQVIFEMETEKVQMEVEADGDGCLKQLVPEGAQLQPGNVVGCLLAHGRRGAAVAARPGRGAVRRRAGDVAVDGRRGRSDLTRCPAHRRSRCLRRPPGMMRISPVARRLADENGIDVRTLTGSGPSGRIVERDVQKAIEAKAAAPVQPATPVATDAPPPLALRCLAARWWPYTGPEPRDRPAHAREPGVDGAAHADQRDGRWTRRRRCCTASTASGARTASS